MLDLDNDSLADVQRKIASERLRNADLIDAKACQLQQAEASAAELQKQPPRITFEEPPENHRRNSLVGQFVSEAGSAYEQCRITNFKAETAYQKKVVSHLQEYIENFENHLSANEGVILYGPVGTGKDHLAFSVAGSAAWRGVHSAKWVNGQSWFGKIRDAMDRDTSESELIAEMGRPEILVFSDPLPPVGTLTQHQATMLYRMIDARYRTKKRVTIITVNVADDAEADERMGAPTWDRMCHNALKINCRWATYRKPKLVITP